MTGLDQPGKAALSRGPCRPRPLHLLQVAGGGLEEPGQGHELSTIRSTIAPDAGAGGAACGTPAASIPWSSPRGSVPSPSAPLTTAGSRSSSVAGLQERGEDAPDPALAGARPAGCPVRSPPPWAAARHVVRARRARGLAQPGAELVELEADEPAVLAQLDQVARRSPRRSAPPSRPAGAPRRRRAPKPCPRPPGSRASRGAGRSGS